MIFGDGAAGALVGSGPVIATHVASRSTHADLVDHFRPSGEAHDYGWEERWVRDEGCMKIALGTLQACLLDAGVAASNIAHFVMPAPLAKVKDAVAKRLGVAPAALVSAARTAGSGREYETLRCALDGFSLSRSFRRVLPAHRPTRLVPLTESQHAQRAHPVQY